jgi:hypothetical protein
MPRLRYSEDAPISDSLAQAIGHLIQQWGHLEDNAAILTAVLLRSRHYDFRGVAANLATAGKFDALAAVAKLTLTARKAATVVAIAERAKRLTAERNRIIHGSWYPTKNPDVAERITYTARTDAGLRQTIATVSTSQVRGFATEVTNLRRRLNHALSRQGFYETRKS